MWQPPNLTLKWGDYFTPDSDDEAKVVTATVAAKGAGLITKRAAVQKLARAFDIENVDQFVLALEEEAAKAQKDAMDLAAAQGPARMPGAPASKKAPAPGAKDKETT